MASLNNNGMVEQEADKWHRGKLAFRNKGVTLMGGREREREEKGNLSKEISSWL